MGLECVILACGHGNPANPVVNFAKFDAHTHCHCQVIRAPCITGRLFSVAMATIVVVGYAFDLLSEAILYLLQTYLTVAMVTLL